MKRNLEIDILKGFGIFLVLFFHVQFGRIFHRYIQAFIMPLFFIASGYLWKNQNGVLERFSRKFRTLMIPYYLLGFFFTAFWTLLYRDDVDGILSAWRIFLFFPTKGIKYGGSLWFLPCMFITDMMYSFIRNINFPTTKWDSKNNFRITIIVIFIAIIGCFYSADKNLPDLLLSFEPAMTALFFIHCGYLIKIITKNDNRLLNLPVPILIILFFFSGFLAFVNPTIDMRQARYSIPPLYFINGVMITIFWWNIAKRISALGENYFINKFFVYLSIDSIIYLLLNSAVIRALKNFSVIFLEKFNINSEGIFGLDMNPDSIFVILIIKIITLILTIIIISLINEFITKIKIKWIIGKNTNS